MEITVYEVYGIGDGWDGPRFSSMTEVEKYIAGKIFLSKIYYGKDLTRSNFEIIPHRVTESVESNLRDEFGDANYEYYQKMKELGNC